MRRDILFILSLLNIKQKISLFFLQILIIFTSLLESLGIFSIAPFISMVANPEIVNSFYIPFSSFDLIERFNLYSINNYGYFLIIFFFFISILNIITNWLIIKYSEQISLYFTSSVYKEYLNKPYKFFLDNNTSVLISKIILESYRVTGGVIKGLMTFNSKLCMAIIIALTLLVFNFEITILICGILSLVYFSVIISINSLLKKTGILISINNKGRVKTIGESFNSIKDIIVRDKSNFFYSNFYKYANGLAKNQIIVSSLSQLPTYALQFLILSTIISAFILLGSDENLYFENIVAIMSIYALAGLRIIPSLNGMFSSFTSIKSSLPALSGIKTDLIQASKSKRKDEKLKFLNLKDYSEISVKNLTFKYSNNIILNKANIKIPIGKMIGLFGETGSGKSTLLNVLTGILEPKNIDFCIDGKIYKFNKLPKINIGYVSQNMFLLDTTIKENIAFGNFSSEINTTKIKKSLEISCANDFVKKLPKKVNCIVGDRGLKLSGGQIQRLSLSRALYFEPDILILDEATNALDKITESRVLNNLNKLKKNNKTTIILISHNQTVLDKCDLIFELRNKKILKKYEKK
tara:strand:+ start:1155 stop:2894 length:1740 start_codon:yes stop_codon:yes gene_type:complete